MALLKFLGVMLIIAYVAAEDCFLEPGYSYDSLWNETSLRVCPGVIRSERVCIVGGGSSGVHLGWLLKRRGFSPILFEKNSRLGGDIWTRHITPNFTNSDDDDFTREVSQQFQILPSHNLNNSTNQS